MDRQKIERITNIVLSSDCRLDAYRALEEYFAEETTNDFAELETSNVLLSTRFDEVFNALKNLYEETEKLKEHCIEQRFIDWEDESIDGCKDLDKALKTAQEYVFNRA